MSDNEFDVMKTIHRALKPLKDDAIARILHYFNKWFEARNSDFEPVKVVGGKQSSPGDNSASQEINGIARLTDSGEMCFTIQDIKAKSANDAAVRLYIVGIQAYNILKNESSVPSKMLVQLLKDHRCYDGNTRRAIAQHKGIMQNGYMRSLDVHAKKEAEKIIREIQDDGFEGRWKPSNKRSKKRKVTLAAEKEG